MPEPRTPETTPPSRPPAGADAVARGKPSTLQPLDSDVCPLPPPPPPQAPALALEAAAPLPRAAPDPSAAGPPNLPGYEILEVLGRGGMGVVYKARHVQLDRLVALKMILGAGHASPQEVARFRREAEAVARLQHPNIVQIYEVGQHNGLAYFSLEYCGGGNLADRTKGTPLPAHQAAQIVATLAGAVHAAHQRGIIHRDLKPANILLQRKSEIPNPKSQIPSPGSETLSNSAFEIWDFDPKVADFGLAKRLDDTAWHTGSGAVVGTPSYMAPEQAGIQGPPVGPAADIYALGAVLYELLTGRPPFKAETPLDTVFQVLNDEPVPPRLLQPKLPRDLETICLTCLQKDPRRRYAGAAPLAEDLRRFRAGEPIQARPVGAVERAVKWVRRRPAAAALWAAGVAAVLFGGGGALWWRGEQAARRALLAGKVEGALAEGRALCVQEKWGPALAAARRAEALMDRGGGDAALGRQVQALLADVDMVERLEAVRLQGSMVKGRLFDSAREDRGYAEAFGRYGLDVLRLAPAEAAARIRERPIRAPLTAALEEWALFRRSAGDQRRLVRIAATVDPDPWRARLRGAALKPDLRALRRLAADPAAVHQPASALYYLGIALARRGDVPAAVGLLRKAQQRQPGDFWINHELAFFLMRQNPPQVNEAVRFFTVAVALGGRSPGAYLNYADALQQHGLLDQARAALEKAIDLKPDYAMAHYNLGNILHAQGKLVAAASAFRRAVALEPAYAEAHHNLGYLLQDQGDLAEAEQAYRRAIALNPDLAVAYRNLGVVLFHQRKLAAAAHACRKAIALEPTNARPFNVLGNALKGQGQLADAVRAYRQAIALHPGYPEAYHNLGAALAAQGKLPEAVAAARQAVALRPDYAAAHYGLGNHLFDQGRFTQAVTAYRRAVALRSDYAEAYYNLGTALLNQGELADALAALKRAHALGSSRRGWSYPSARDVERAERLMRLDAKLPAILSSSLQPASAAERVELAGLCQMPFKRFYAAAARFYGEAFAAEPKFAEDMRAGRRYSAACAAALAGCGHGADAGRLDDKDKVRLRGQALKWLRADLTAWQKLLPNAANQARAAGRQTLQHWQTDSDLAGVRDKAALAKLSETERQDWAKLWDEVAALLAKAGPKK
jgi:serine/threonine-protein kinase